MLSDGAGVVRGTFTFDSYGNLTAATGSSTSSFWFSGQYRDSETGLIYLRARYYDPVTGQFISRDPAVAATRQPYGYTGDNPLNAVDPSGLYEYYASFGLGNWGASGATDAMAILQSYPSASFPWPISGDHGETSIKKGSTYTLTDRPIPFHDTDRVKVTAMTATSFTFTALAGHIEGEGGTITFSTYVDSNGNTILQMHAKGPDFLGLPFWPVNEARFAEATKFWGRMAENVLAQLQLEHMNDTPCDFLW
jgi:RHS repeat-associated protein